MVDEQKRRAIQALRDDMRAVYGECIPVEQLTGMLGFNTESSLRRALRGRLSLVVHREHESGDRYVCVDELTNWLVAQYSEAAGRNDLND